MSTYRSKPVEIEARQWFVPLTDTAHGLEHNARLVVAWVNANGGEARYEPETGWSTSAAPGRGLIPARIAVRTINGWAYAEPGHYVVMGDATFTVCVHGYSPATCNEHHNVRDFYPCDPETFDRRWELAGSGGDGGNR